jgi:hypothetical protein
MFSVIKPRPKFIRRPVLGLDGGVDAPALCARPSDAAEDSGAYCPQTPP